LHAMLVYSRISGGSEYVASAILAARSARGREDAVVGLNRLADDWFFHFLWPMKALASSERAAALQGIFIPSDQGIESTEASAPSIREQTLKRDNHRCVISLCIDDQYDGDVPSSDISQFGFDILRHTRILPRHLFVVLNDDVSDTTCDTTTTFDMIKHLARIPDESELVERKVDSMTENTLTLQIAWCGKFLDFAWCFLSINLVRPLIDNITLVPFHNNVPRL